MVSDQTEGIVKQLISVSEKPSDLKKFNNNWEEVRSFTREEGLDGIELVFGYESGSAIPGGLVKTVHLPIWFGWTRTWGEPESVPADCDPSEESSYFGAVTPEKLLDSFCKNLERADEYNASYAVVHIGHLEFEEIFTRSYRFGSREILSAGASFLNAISSRFPHGEPPVTLGFENLWTTGLTFRSEEDVRFFTDLLTFENWIFLLDTGHLMNGLNVRDEQEGIRKVMSTLKLLSDETIEKMRAIHFQCSTSGEYQETHLGYTPPPSFKKMEFREKMDELKQFIPLIDEHRPFSDPACRSIIDLIQPDFLVHELKTNSREDLHRFIQQQKGLISGI